MFCVVNGYGLHDFTVHVIAEIDYVNTSQYGLIEYAAVDKINRVYRILTRLFICLFEKLLVVRLKSQLQAT